MDRGDLLLGVGGRDCSVVSEVSDSTPLDEVYSEEGYSDADGGCKYS